MHSQQAGALILGQALHAPWNEGTRVIGRNLIDVVGGLRAVHAVSLTHESFRHQLDDAPQIQHVFTGADYGISAGYLSMRDVQRRIDQILAGHRIDVAHLIGVPLAFAPWLRRRGVRVIAHVTLAEQAYIGKVERLRAALGWRLFDRWIGAYAPSAQALESPLLRRGIARSKLTVVPAPVDTDFFSPGDRAEARARMGFHPEQFTICYVGTLSPLRFPVDTIRDALQRFGAESREECQFLAFAPAATHPYNQAWSDSVRASLRGIPNVLTEIHLRDLTPAEKVACFRAADAVLVPFAGPVAVEPPLTLVEAMACGAVPIVSPQANRSGLVQHGANGHEFGWASDLAASLRTIAHGAQAGGNAQLRARARETAVREHGFAATGQAVANLWSTLAEGSVA